MKSGILLGVVLCALTGCTFYVGAGPRDLVQFLEPVDGAEGISRQPAFHWKILDQKVRESGALQCRLYELETYEDGGKALWMVVNVQKYSAMTFPYGPTGQLGFGAADQTDALKPNTEYIAVFTYSIVDFSDFDPVTAEFTTGED